MSRRLGHQSKVGFTLREHSEEGNRPQNNAISTCTHTSTTMPSKITLPNGETRYTDVRADIFGLIAPVHTSRCRFPARPLASVGIWITLSFVRGVMEKKTACTGYAHP